MGLCAPESAVPAEGCALQAHLYPLCDLLVLGGDSEAQLVRHPSPSPVLAATRHVGVGEDENHLQVSTLVPQPRCPNAVSARRHDSRPMM